MEVKARCARMEGRIFSLMKYVNRTIFRGVVQSKISLNGLSSTIFYPERVPDYVIEHFPDGEWQKSFEKDSILEKEEIDALCENLPIVASLLLWPIGGVMMPWSGSVLIHQKILKLLMDLTSRQCR